MSVEAHSVNLDAAKGDFGLEVKLDDNVEQENICTPFINANQNIPDNSHVPNDSSSPSPATSSRSSSLDLSDIRVANLEESSYDNNILNECSTAAQHIRQTITEVLNSRVEEIPMCSNAEDIPYSLEVSLKQKLEDFENTVKNNISPSAVRPFNSLESVGAELKCTVLPEKSVPISSEHLGDSKVYDDSNSTEDTKVEEIERKVATKKQNCSGTIINSDSGNKNSIITQCSSEEEKSHKRSQRNTENRRKGEKSIDNIMKSLSNLPSVEDKLLALCRKHSEALDDLKSTELRMKQGERQNIQLTKEKEQLQADHNRMVLAKSRLESLCRELQRQNKAVKEESLLRIREEEEKRKEVASKFQTTLNEISNLMQENSKKNLQLKEENAELAQKLKTLVEHYEMWEKHMEKVVQQKDLEAQLAKAQHAKTNLQLKQETEKFLREKQSLLENMSELQNKCTQLASNELKLRAELGDYTSKYEEFQTVLSKSNQVFASFKTDMETTSKKIKKLERQTNVWKQKWESSNNALLEMVSDKQKRDKELLNCQQRVLTLEKLCRALQAERNDLQSKVKAISDCKVAAAEDIEES